ncbi:MAG: hypothetical protein AB7O57_04640 [Hyphomicrobiaceae bacterium]
MTGDEIADVIEGAIAGARQGAIPITGIIEGALSALPRLPAALDVALPIIRKVILPAVENILTTREYVDLEVSLAALEAVRADLAAAAALARVGVQAMTDEQVDEYLTANDLFRKDA